MELERLSGVLVHPTSFPSRFGIGDLGKGAYDFIDFLKKGEQKLWQVLPLNPTSFGDSPYQSFSTFAGNHFLISPELLVKDGFLLESDLVLEKEFSANRVDYGEVITFKNALHKKAYANFKKAASAQIKTEFNKFCKQNKEWLDGYCLFVSLKFYFIDERNNTFETPEYKKFALENEKYLSENQVADYFYGAVWSSWPQDIAKREKSAVIKWTKLLEEDINFHKFLQFLFFRQWADVKTYANENDVRIIGDIPIFVALDSADVWCARELFLLDADGFPTSVAGVPPDYFSETGQLWGNPLYNWDEHKANDYSWWIKRIEGVLRVADIIRIDHFRGFESYWSVEYGAKTAIEGKWMKGPGKDLFAAIKKQLGALPIIAEDLGIITDKVEKLRDGLGLPGMKVLQFGFDAGSNNANMPHNFKTSNMIVYTGTHDNDTTCGWYETCDKLVQDQFRRYLNVSGEDAAWDMIRLAFMTCAAYAIVPIQDLMSLKTEDRMNVPGVPENNWQFRYTKEMLSENFAERLAYLAELTDRNII